MTSHYLPLDITTIAAMQDGPGLIVIRLHPVFAISRDISNKEEGLHSYSSRKDYIGSTLPGIPP